MVHKVGVILGLTLLLLTSGVGIAAADFHESDDYDTGDWDDGGSVPDGGGGDSNDGSDSGLATTPTSTFSGVAMPIPKAVQSELKTSIDSAESAHPGSQPELWLFMNQETTAIVASENPIQMGEVEIDGYQSHGGSVSVIVAESVNVDANPETVSGDDLSESTGNYEYQYVESSAPVKHVPFAYETADENVMQPTTTGSFDSQTVLAGRGQLLPPTALANQVAVNASRILGGGVRGLELVEYRVSGGVMLDSHQQDTWIVDSEATIRGVVLDRPVGSPASQASTDFNWLYAENVQANAESTQDFSRVVDRSEAESRFTVTTEADLLGSSISTKEALVAASACDGRETVGSAPNCVPAITDMTVRTGVAVADGGDYQALPFIAATNDLQGGIIEPLSGRYQITGEVIDFQNVHPGFSGRGLLIYEMERIGGVEVDGNVREQAQNDGETVVGEVREQLEVQPSEYESYANSKQQQNPVSSSEDGESTENEGDGQQGIGEVTADGGASTILLTLISILISLAMVRRVNQ